MKTQCKSESWDFKDSNSIQIRFVCFGSSSRVLFYWTCSLWYISVQKDVVITCESEITFNSKTVHRLSSIHKEGNEQCFISTIKYGCYFCWRNHDLIHTHPNSYPYFIIAIKHLYMCSISLLTVLRLSSDLYTILAHCQSRCIFRRKQQYTCWWVKA